MATDQPKDILVDISDQDLTHLAEIYREHQNRLPHVFNFLHTMIKWRQSSKYRNCITIMSPIGDCWKKDGTFVGVMEYGFHSEIFMFTLDKTCQSLCKGLKDTNRIDFKEKNTLLYCLHEDLFPEVTKTLELKGATFQIHHPVLMFAMSIAEAKNLKVECAPEVYLKELDISNAAQINNVWPHRNPGSEEEIALLIELNGGYGVFLKSTNQLVSWVLVQCLGQLGMLQTEEEFMRKGYGMLVTKKLSQKLAEAGFIVFGTVIRGNEKSEKMFRKLGFKEIGISMFSLIKGENA